MAITDIPLNRITDPKLLKKLQAKAQFHGIADYLIFENGIPIPVVSSPSA